MQRGCSAAALGTLDGEVLSAICSLLDPISLASFSCTSKSLRHLISSDALWESFCRARWANINASCKAGGAPQSDLSHNTAPGKAVAPDQSHLPMDYGEVYASNNGWNGLHVIQTQGHPAHLYAEQQFCVSSAPAAELWNAVGDTVYTLASTLSVWSTGDYRQPGRLMASNALEKRGWYSMTEVNTGTVAVGDAGGIVCLYNALLEDPSAELQPHEEYKSPG